MDLFGLCAILLVLLLGTCYVACILYSTWREARSNLNDASDDPADANASIWVQHTLTLFFAFAFLSVGASMCASILQGESHGKAIQQLQTLISGETSDSDLTWGENGNQGALHYAQSAGGRRVIGASLAYIEFDDTDLERLVEQYPHIKWFILSGTQIDDQALEILADRENLTALVLTDTAITDDGLSVFQGHHHIQELDLTRTAITDRSLRIASSLPALQHLNLRQTAVTDKGLKQLEGNTSLKSLNLQGTQITDAAVSSLVTIENLKLLRFRDTDLSSQALAQLQRVLPKCEVTPGCP